MDDVIKKSLNKAMSYKEYKDLITGLVQENSNSGLEKAENLAEYTKLNERRMKRWDKTVKISAESEKEILKISTKTTLLVITESWCGDAAHVIPVLNKVVALNDNLDIKFVLRDDNLELMDMFLTNGGRAIAKVIVIDDEKSEVVNTYGPRPTKATDLVNAYKKEHGKLTPEFKEDLQRWYNKNKGQNIIEDILNLLR